jgi:hypothetical protein
VGEQVDLRRTMEARRMASMEPATRQANRGGAADAVGGSHSGRRADSESARAEDSASAERASAPAADCLLFEG